MRRRKQHIAEDMQPVLVGRRRMQKENRTRQDDVEQISTSQDSNSRFYSSQQKQESVNGYVYRHGKYYATSTKTHRHEAGASRTVLSRLSERHSSVHMKFQGCNRFKICPSIPLYCLLIIILNTLIGAISCIVVYQVGFAATKSGRTDYAFAGETIELTCRYAMKDDVEDVKQVTWSKDGKNFLRWKKNKPGLEVLSYLFKGHIDQTSTYSLVIIHNVTIEMHGKFKCSIKTDLGTHTGEQDLIIISSQHCRRNDWRVQSEQTKCRETFRFDCRDMFPKPVTSCGLWNSKLDKFIRSVTVDISEEPSSGHSQLANGNNNNQTVIHSTAANVAETFRIRYTDKFALKFLNGSTNPQHSDLLQYAGNLIFKCDIIVPETSWKLSFVYRMFEYQDGCNQDPLEAIERMRVNFSHYASRRLQQAGYLNQQAPEDIEMLTTSLKYEIIPPSYFISGDRNSLVDRPSPQAVTIAFGQHANKTSKSQNNGTQQPKIDQVIDLNCWQKPRVGSFARLYCANKHKNQVKLVGANLFECRPNGWFPVKSSISSMGGSAVIRKHQAIERNSAGRRPTRAERPDGQVLIPGVSNSNRIEGLANMEDDDDDSARLDPGAPEMSSEIERSSKAHTIDPLDAKVRFENEVVQQFGLNDYEQLTPAELASLLPTCVSIAQAKPRKPHNRLPMIEASSVNNNGKLLSKDGRNLNNDNDNWNWYIFSNSASTSTHHYPNQRSLMILTIVAFMTMILMTGCESGTYRQLFETTAILDNQLELERLRNDNEK